MSADRTTETSPATKQSRGERLLSIDALRGFDMFWITGGDALALAVLGLFSGAWAESLKQQLEHVEWQGFRFYDLIFPLFLFLVGCVLPFSLAKYRDRPADVYVRIARRTAALILLGLIGNGLLKLNFAELRYAGVLQRIGICYGAAALVFLHLRLRGQIALWLSILIGYWLILRFVPVPDGTAGDMTAEGNLAGYIDRHFLPGKIMKPYYGFGDNEGILSTIPAVATAMLGAFAGQWLKSQNSQSIKAIGLAGAGVTLIGIGLLWSVPFPIIKNLWTSSFVLVAGGCSLLLLALFYTVIDVIGFKAWSFFFVVIGMNAITIYVGDNFIDFPKMSQYFFGGVMRLLKEGGYEQAAQVVFRAGIVFIEWLVLWFLYSKRVFLRV
ncbi:MAG: DUF5009 domain-containing protein [Pirellulales bacterium]